MATNWAGRIAQQFRLLEEARTTRWNKDIIRWFLEHYKPVSDNRKDKYIRYLRHMAVLVGKSFNRMSKDDVGPFVQALEKRFLEEWTFVDCKTMFKTFFRFYMDYIADDRERQREYMRLVPTLKAVGKIETSFRRHKEKKLVILTKEEIEKLLKAASNGARELAIVTLLYHTAARPSEFLNMTLGDVDSSGDGTLHFTVTGKTGTRKLPLAADQTAAQVCTSWINQHPRSGDTSARFWLNTRGTPLESAALYVLIRRLARKAGIRHVAPKLLRKAKLSHMADDGYSAYQIKKYAGHRKLETAMFYVELSQKGFEAAIRKQYGQREVKQSVLLPKKCWKCGCLNKSFNTRCSECGKPLDLQAAMARLDERSDLIASVMTSEMLDKLADLVADKLAKSTSTPVTRTNPPGGP